MQTVSQTILTERDRALFSPLPDSSLAGRLARAIADATREIARGPLSYLRAAFLPENINDWLPLRSASALARFVAHPIAPLTETLRRDAMLAGFINPPVQPTLAFTTNVASSGGKADKRRDLLMPILAVSASVHAVFIGY